MTALVSCLVEIKAVPGAPRSEVVGWVGDALKVRLKAPPVEGQANAELCRFLAATLELPRGADSLVSGARSRQKRVKIQGLSREALIERYPR